MKIPHVRRTGRWLGVSLAMMLMVPLSAAAGSGGDLGAVRGATAKYHQIEDAIADGYELGYNGIITGCIAHPTQGAMGYHYFRADLIDDPSIDPLQPEGLVYESLPNGRLKLVAVEWIVPGPVPPDPTIDAPMVLGHDMHVLNPALGWYIHHAWVWKNNPSGMFSDWNPDVTCP